eukprot:365313-Chlamydomonas_euryale.AAC.12
MRNTPHGTSSCCATVVAPFHTALLALAAPVAFPGDRQAALLSCPPRSPVAHLCEVTPLLAVLGGIRACSNFGVVQRTRRCSRTFDITVVHSTSAPAGAGLR